MGLSCLIICFSSATQLFADEKEAALEIKKAEKYYSENKYEDAAIAYKAAELYTDSPDEKFNSLQKAAEAYGRAKLKYKQFECIRGLIEGFPDKIDINVLTQKEYELGNEFYKGHRDILLSWLPWIKGKNKSKEIYETVLQQAPFAKFAPIIKLRLGRIYLEEGKNLKALNTFREIIAQHSNAIEAKYARFELANALVQMSGKAGDGDGAYAREAEEVLKETMKLYPKNPETQWIKESINETDAMRAARIYKRAKFYESRKNEDAAKYYYGDLIARFPKSEYAKSAIKRLKNLDENYTIRPVAEDKKEKDPYPVLSMKKERNVILVTPKASGGKWLLPIDDLDLDSSHAYEEYKARKVAEEAAKKREEARIAEEKRRIEAAKKKRAAEIKARQEAEAKRKAEEAKLAEEKRKAEAAAKAAKIQKAIEDAKKLAAEKKAALDAKKRAEKNKKVKEDKPTKRDVKSENQVKKITSAEKSSKVKIKKEKKESFFSKYWIPIVLIILALIVGMILLFRKKKAQV